jgi:hypothetical protein
MKQLSVALLLIGLASCGELKPFDPMTNPDLLVGLCGDATWLKSTLSRMQGSPMKWEIHTNIYNGVRVFEVADCISGCSDAMGVVYDCSGKVLCQFGGIAGMNTCPDYPFSSDDRVLLWHN